VCEAEGVVQEPVREILPNELCSVFVSSCDAYADLWVPFFTLFWRYWPDCPFPVYLGTNELRYDDHRVTTVNSEGGLSWAEQARRQISTIETPYVLLVLEDFFLRKPTPTKDLLELLATLGAVNGRMLRLTNRPPPDEPADGHSSIGLIRPGAPYRVSTQATIWHRDTLLELLKPGESIWEFEEAASRRSDRYINDFYSVWRQALPYGYHVVQQGKWFRHEARRFAQMKIGCDFIARPVMTRKEALRARFEYLKSWFLHQLPWPTRLRVLALARKLGI
jgi:hypothetical protein